MKYIDLHVHTDASDGSYTPEALVQYALKQNLCAIAITDHDTTDGLLAAEAAVGKLNQCAEDSEDARWCMEHVGVPVLRLIPGIELSASYQGKDVHILGYGIQYQNPEFQERLKEFRENRKNRNAKILERIQNIGCPLTQEELDEAFGSGVITRAHYALLMVRHGFVQDKDEAFQKYLNPGKPCFVPREKIQVEEAIRLIHSVGGIAVLAHPLMYHLSRPEVEHLVSHCKKCGIEGMEAIYSKNTGDDEQDMKRLAEQYHLFITGGTDFHGAAKPTLKLGTGYGDMRIPVELLTQQIQLRSLLYTNIL